MPIPIPFQRIKKRLINNYHNCDCVDITLIHFLESLEGTKNYSQLCALLKEFFYYLCKDKILDGEIIDLAESEFNKYEIYHNTAINNGYALISKSHKSQETDDSMIEVGGDATIVLMGYSQVILSGRARGYAFDNSLIRMYADSVLCAYDNTSVFAFGDTTIYAFDNSFVRADSYSSVVAHNNSSVRAMCKSNIKAKDNSKIVLMGLAVAIIYDNTVTVEAKGESYLSSHGKITCKLKDKAIYHDLESNTLYYSYKNMKFENINKIEV